MVFTLDIKHTSQFGDEANEINTYSYSIGVDLIKETPSEIMYDKKQKIYFQNELTKGFLFRLNYLFVILQPSKRLLKAKDFNRRITYRYDWADIKVMQTGKIQSIENASELRLHWSRLKQRLTNDYIGKAVDNYIREIDRQFDENNSLEHIASCHQLFGLLFLGIPPKHKSDWGLTKEIALSEYESEKFIETVKYVETIDNIRRYEIVGETKPDTKINLLKYVGRILIPNNELFPDSVDVNVEYLKGEVLNKWLFRLDRCQ